jgi:anti-sigma regulatory factor (Ser/Thr protein kinase)
MDTLPLVSTDTNLFENVRRLAAETALDEFTAATLVDPGHALGILNLEMPELVCIDFADANFDSFSLLSDIMADPWIFHGGIIALCEGYENYARIEETEGANIIVAIMHEDLRRRFPKILDIVRHNRRILFQRDLGVDIVSNISGSFKLENDPLEASCFANLISNFLCNANRIGQKDKPVLTTAVFEMLMNAIEHGNCGITYEEKSAWLDKGEPIQALIDIKNGDPAVARKRVTFEYSILPECARFFIADEGAGFDWRGFLSGERRTDELALHGRGILMANHLMRNLRYNEAGNEVNFEIAYRKDVSVTTPELFRFIGPRDVNPGDVVFGHGEPGNFMYYIVKGQYDVIVNGTVMSTLSPDDVFMGEMSFLLNNRRNATVRAKTEGTLIPVSKDDFVKAVKRKPHYALFLARLLAQRIERSNRRAFGV